MGLAAAVAFTMLLSGHLAWALGFPIDVVASCSFSRVRVKAATAILGARPRRTPLRRRCHPLLHRDAVDLDEALLRMHAAQEMKEFWVAAKHVLHAALPI